MTLEDYIKTVKKEGDKVIEYFYKKGFNHDIEGDNIRFYTGFSSLKDYKSFKLSLHSFYGYSRLAYITEFIAENKVKLTPVTNEMWMENYIKPIIEKQLL